MSLQNEVALGLYHLVLHGVTLVTSVTFVTHVTSVKEEAERCARARCKGRVKLNIKGCVQQTISYLKTDLCNQISDAGKMLAHGTNITKS